MRNNERIETRGGGGVLALRAFASLVLVVAMGFATFGVGYAIEVVDEPAIVAEGDDIVAVDPTIPEEETIDETENEGIVSEDEGNVPNDSATNAEEVAKRVTFIEPMTLSAQSDDDDAIAQYPELAAKILNNYVKRSSEPIDISSYDIDFSGVQSIVNALLKQHPELVDISTGFSIADKQFVPEYMFTDKPITEILAMRHKMAREIAHAMSWIPENGTDLQKVKAAHDWLVAHIYYDYETLDLLNTLDAESVTRKSTAYGNVLTNIERYAYCAYGPLAKHTGVCDGITYAFMLLMDQCGIECEHAVNPPAAHAWNHVKIDGNWYNVDVTWDLNDTKEGGGTDYNYKINSEINSVYWKYFLPGYIKYDYFMKSDDFIESLDQSKGKVEHVNYDPYGNYSHCTNTSYDSITHDDWEVTAPLPNAKYTDDDGAHEKTQVTSFGLSATTLTLGVGETGQLAVQNVDPATISPLASTWTSSDTSVAYVCADGTVVGIGEGTATITCTMGDEDLPCEADRWGRIVQTCEVTVGNEAVVTEPKFTNAQLLLGEQIKMRYWLTVPENFDGTDASAVFSIGGKKMRTTEPITIADATYDSANSRYAFDFELSSIEMAEPVTCTFTYGDGETVGLVYSVKQYVQAALDSDRLSEAEKACVRAVANYGHYMQLYLATSNGWVIGTDYAEMDLSYEDVDADGADDKVTATMGVQAYMPRKSGDGVSDIKVTCSLGLNSYTTLDLFFTPAADAEFDATATFNGQEYTATKVGNKYRFRIDRIKAAQLGDKATVTGTVNGKEFDVEAGPLSYACAVLNGSFGYEADNAMVALYHYYNTAKQL